MISIIIPTRNRKLQLTKCLDALLHQTRLDLIHEVIIVDDHSKEGLYKGLLNNSKYELLNVKFIYNDKQFGPSYSRNQASLFASGNVLAFLDDDSFAHLEWVEQIGECMSFSNVITGEILNAHSKIYPIPFIRQIRYDIRQKQAQANPYNVTFFSGGNSAIVADIFRKIGGFDDGLKIMSDNELLIKLKPLNINCRYCDNVIVYHLHNKSIWTAFLNSWRAGSVISKSKDQSAAKNVESAMIQNRSEIYRVLKFKKVGYGVSLRIKVLYWIMNSIFLFALFYQRIKNEK